MALSFRGWNRRIDVNVSEELRDCVWRRETVEWMK